MKPGTSNRHHGVPRSFTGSNDDSNLTTLDEREHARFHLMAGHQPPCFFTRGLLLSSVDWQNAAGSSIPVGAFRAAFAQLMQPDWKNLYVRGTVRDPGQVHSGEEGYWARAAVHLNNRLYEESFLTADAMAYLESGQHPRPSSRGFRSDAMEFFGAVSPPEAAASYFISRTGSGDYKWTKPLLQPVRREMLGVLRGAKPEVRRNKQRAELLQLLEEHRHRLLGCLSGWEPRSRDYERLISADGRIAALRLDARKIA